MSLKDRGAILPAGHFANWAFWYSKTGSFISSSFMARSFQTGFRNSMMKSTICLISIKVGLLKPKYYNESLEDNNPYEGKLYNSSVRFSL
jgi:hypothetical protein